MSRSTSAIRNTLLLKILSCISLTLLYSCGGGGGGGSTTNISSALSNFTGVAVDGNLYQAKAFLDLNGNGVYDSGEPTATTDSNGSFSLSATQDQINSHSVVVSAIAGTTIDQDSPNTPLTSGMTLIAPAGNPSVVSPLTTQVSAKMAGGLSLADAKSAVQTELGLTNVDVMKNYVTEKVTNSAYSDAHKIAASVAEILKTIDQQSTVNTTLATKLSTLTTNVTNQVAPISSQIKSSTSLDDARTTINNSISAAASIYSVGGSITGLNSDGLVLINGTNTVSPISGASTFTFSSKKATGGTYSVSIQSNPSTQTCSVLNGSGTVTNQSISNVAISCVNNFGALSGTVSGLTTSGLVLKNGTEELSVSSGLSTFQFVNTVSSGASFAVTVKTNPIGKTCSVANASGTMSNAGVSNVTVTCSNNSYTLGGSISGLSVSGLKLKNGSETLIIASGSTSFTFSSTVAYGGGYAVTVDAQPTGYTCSLINPSGSMGSVNITSVQVACSMNSYTLSGSIVLLDHNGLVLQNGNEELVVPGNTFTDFSVQGTTSSFQFNSKVPYGSPFDVSIKTQPIGETCYLSNGSGTMTASGYNGVTILCTHNSYSISGSISGLTSSGLNLNNNGQLATSTISSGSTSFVINGVGGYGSSYSLSVRTQPTGQTCSVTNGTGTVTDNISNVVVSCVINPKLYRYDMVGQGFMANSGTVTTGQSVTFHLFFNKKITVSGGSPTINLTSGGIGTYVSGSDSNTQYLPSFCQIGDDSSTATTCNGYLRFTYTAGSQDSTNNLLITQINLNGASIVDSSGNSIDPTSIPPFYTRINFVKVNQ